MRKKSIHALSKVEGELDKLAHFVSEGIKSFLRYLHAARGGEASHVPAAAPRATKGAPAAAPRGRRAGRRTARQAPNPDRWPWAQLLPAAQKLLKKDPTRQWHSGEFCRAIKEIVGMDSVRGMHFALIPRLRKDGVIQKSGKGTFRAKQGGTGRRGPGRRARA